MSRQGGDEGEERLNSGAATPDLTDEQRHQFAPHGTMRVGLAVGATVSAIWSTRDAASGDLRGVAVDLGAELADWLGLELEYVELASSGEIVATADEDRWDVAFVPVDEERKRQVGFTTDYHRGVSTFLVPADATCRDAAGVDVEGMRVVGVEETATIRTARRKLSRAEIVGVPSLGAALDLFRAGEVQALALGRDSLQGLAAELPGSRIVDGHFHAAGSALAMPKGREAALAVATRFVEEAKATGLVARILRANGLSAEGVAPLGERS